MPTALIIGASRGIGQELARAYLADGYRVLATVRNMDSAPALQALGAEVHLLDVCNLEHCASLAWKLDGEELDVAILNAGVSGKRSAGLETPHAEEFDQVMHTNVLAAMRILPQILPMVSAASGRLAVISSVMGSLTARTNNAMWLYRASKAALNSVLRDVALDRAASGVICVTLHPGWVRTDMGGPDADLDVTTSVAGIRATLAALKPSDTGTFLEYNGAPIAW